MAHGDWGTASHLLVQTQTQVGRINTVYVERHNATFMARLPSLPRRTRNLA